MKRKQIDHNWRWKRAFEAVMETYEDARTQIASLKTDGFYEELGVGRGHATSTRSPLVVRPSLVDFVCDVELAAKDVLSDYEYKFLKTVFMFQEHVSDMVRNTDDFQRMADSISHRVGRAFISLRIYPTRVYFRPKDLR